MRPDIAGSIAIFLILLRLLNNLLKADIFGLGQISLLSLAEKSSDGVAGLKAYLNEPSRLNLAVQIFDKVSFLLLVWLIYTIQPVLSAYSFLWFFLYLLIFDLVLPTSVAAFIPEVLVTRLFPLLHLFYTVEWPLVRLLSGITRRGKMSEESDEEEDPEDREAFLRAGAEEGIIEEKEKSLIRNVIDFNDTVVREVMTPRTDMICIEHDMETLQILEVFKKSKLSRLPIYRGNIDQIEGFIRFKDLMEIKDSHDDISGHITEAAFVPEQKSISDLLQEMLKSRVQMAIVIDEFGGTAGLITLEDLLEEIVGEIHDEHEAPESDEIIDLKNGGHLVDGKVLLNDFCELFSVDVVDEDVDTIGGYIFNKEGRIPQEGDTCMIGDRKIKIAKAYRRRIYKVTVTGPTSDVAGA